MGDHRAERLPIECPICRVEVDGRLRDHLESSHSKAELADQIMAYYDAAEQGSLA